EDVKGAVAEGEGGGDEALAHAEAVGGGEVVDGGAEVGEGDRALAAERVAEHAGIKLDEVAAGEALRDLDLLRQVAQDGPSGQRGAAQVVAAEVHLAGVRQHAAGDAADEGRLAGAVGADEDEGLTGA